MSEPNWKNGFEIVWHGDAPPEGTEAAVRADMLRELSVSHPSRLIYHTVFLGSDIHGPSVAVWGKDGDPRFHATYDTITKWETLSGEELPA